MTKQEGLQARDEKTMAQVAHAAEAITELMDRLLAEDVPLSIVIDQLITYGAFASVQVVGEAATAAQFQAFGVKVGSGFFRQYGAGERAN